MAEMEAAAFLNYGFYYPGAERPALWEVDFSVEEGEYLLLCGETGSGKTTLLRSLKREVAPVGKRLGDIRIFSRLQEEESGEVAVGFVAQHPDNQLVMDTVHSELAFGLQNIGLPLPVVQRRIAETAHFFGMEDKMQRKVHTLSGGEKQILNLASVLVMQPRLLLLDEPTAQLDPIAAKAFLQMVKRVNSELGMTVLLSEHRMEDVLDQADRVVFLKEGRLAHSGFPQEFVRHIYAAGSTFSAALPAPARVAHRLGEGEAYPLNVKEGRVFLRQLEGDVCCREIPPAAGHLGDPVLEAKSVWFRYGRQGAFVLQDASFTLVQGETHALLGGNGSGKSTLLSLLCRLDAPVRGKVVNRKEKRVGLLPQSPQAVFTGNSLWEELTEWQQRFGYGEGEIHDMLDSLRLSHLKNRHPYDLSGGEMQKAALAKLLLVRPDILLLDEPTKGIDAAGKRELEEILKELRRQGKTVLLVTHDVEFAALTAQRCSLLFEGRVVCTEESRQFFSSNVFYTTETNRMTRGRAEGCVVAEDVVKC